MTLGWAIVTASIVISLSWITVTVLTIRKKARSIGLHEMVPAPGAIQLSPEQRAQYEKEVQRVIEEARSRREQREKQRSERGGYPPFDNTRPPRHTIQQQR